MSEEQTLYLKTSLVNFQQVGLYLKVENKNLARLRLTNQLCTIDQVENSNKSQIQLEEMPLNLWV
jgi:hypothetical protein